MADAPSPAKPEEPKASRRRRIAFGIGAALTLMVGLVLGVALEPEPPVLTGNTRLAPVIEPVAGLDHLKPRRGQSPRLASI